MFFFWGKRASLFGPHGNNALCVKVLASMNDRLDDLMFTLNGKDSEINKDLMEEHIFSLIMEVLTDNALQFTMPLESICNKKLF